jgi:hypothetical protein
LGLHDNATASITLVDPDGTVVLWASEAGDRSLMWCALARRGAAQGCQSPGQQSEEGAERSEIDASLGIDRHQNRRHLLPRTMTVSETLTICGRLIAVVPP